MNYRLAGAGAAAIRRALRTWEDAFGTAEINGSAA